MLIIGGGITGGILAFSGDKEESAKEPEIVQPEPVDSTKKDSTEVDTVVTPPQGGPTEGGPKTGGQKGVDEQQPVVDPPTPPATSKNLGYGKYEGAMKNGQPHGTGTIYYTTRHQVVPSKDIYAESGDYVTGSFRDGKLMSGQLHHKDGNQEFVQR